MASSRPKSTELSEFTSFSVTPVDGDSVNITVVYKNPSDLTREPPPSFKFFVIGQEKPIDLPMIYSEKHEQWEVSVDTSKEARGFFQIMAGGNSLDSGNIGLTNGHPHPRIYKDPSSPQGTLTTLLYRKDGSLADPVPEAELKTGDRLITVYLPPGYQAGRAEPYNLQIGLDGDDLRTMQTNIMLDNMIAKKEIEPVVAIFIPPWNGPPDLKAYPNGVEGPPGYCGDMRTKEYACNAEVAKNVAITLPQAVKEHFKFTSTPEHTTITGVSISAEQALFTALSYPKSFGSVIAQSPAAHWSPNLLLMERLPDVGTQSEQTSIVTREGLYQLSEDKRQYELILAASKLEELGLTKLIEDGLKDKNLSFYHALSLDQFRKLNQALERLEGKKARFDMHGNGCSRLLHTMIKADEFETKGEKPLKAWLQAGKTENDEFQPIRSTTEELATALKEKGVNASYRTHEGGHDYIEWRCSLQAAEVAMHQPVKVELTFEDLQRQAALVSKSEAGREVSFSLDSPGSEAVVNTSDSTLDKDFVSNPESSTTRTKGLT